jgi:hypothetical protein
MAANSNFLDIAILDWCKLFAEWDGQQHWRKTITDRHEFRSQLFNSLNMSEGDFCQYKNSVKHYRDKFISHLDEEHVMHPPRLCIAWKSTVHLYSWLRGSAEHCAHIQDACHSAMDLYKQAYKPALLAYRNLNPRIDSHLVKKFGKQL